MRPPTYNPHNPRPWPNGVGRDYVTTRGTWECLYPYGSGPWRVRYIPHGEHLATWAGMAMDVHGAIAGATPCNTESMSWQRLP